MTMPVDIETSQTKLWLGGALERDLVRDNLLEVMVEQDLFLPDALTLRLVDVKDQPGLSAGGYFQLLDSDRFAIGKAIKVALGQDTPEVVFEGEITSIELDLSGAGAPTLVVRGLDTA